jgi:hypothetical protein
MEAIQKVIHEATHNIDNTDMLVEIEGIETKIALNKLQVISPEDAPKLDDSQKWILMEDVGAHMIEGTGLDIFALGLITNDPKIRLPLSLAFLVASYFACKSERTSCLSTLMRKNAYEQGKIILDPKATGEADFWTILSAVIKFPALLIASIFELDKIFLGFLPAAILLAVIIAIADTICQYIINSNNISIGEVQNQQAQNNNNHTSKWNQLSRTGQGLILSRAVGTANERAAAIVLMISLLARFSPKYQAVTAGVAFLVYLSTTYSLVNYTDIPHMLRKTRPLLGGLIHTLKDKPPARNDSLLAKVEQHNDHTLKLPLITNGHY